ncbi:hypothetical protein NDU88_003649, partial [Pleurodeles waltl]
EGPSHRTLPPGVDTLFSQAISHALAPLRDTVAKLTEQVSRGTGMFGVTGAEGDSSTLSAPRKMRKRDAGHLGDGVFSPNPKSARAHKRVPSREDRLPGVLGDKLHHLWNPDLGSPKGFMGGSDEDSSSLDDDSGRPWRPGATLPDPSDHADSDSDMFEPEGIYHPRSSEWRPDHKVAEYVASKIRQPLDKEVRARLRAECPRPSLSDKVA